MARAIAPRANNIACFPFLKCLNFSLVKSSSDAHLCQHICMMHLQFSPLPRLVNLALLSLRSGGVWSLRIPEKTMTLTILFLRMEGLWPLSPTSQSMAYTPLASIQLLFTTHIEEAIYTYLRVGCFLFGSPTHDFRSIPPTNSPNPNPIQVFRVWKSFPRFFIWLSQP